MLKRLRILFAVLFWLGITLLFLDFTGLAAQWLGWMAKLQLLPALLAGNLIAIAVLVVLTLVFGRLYCSVICPLGVMQDGFAALGRKARRNRYSYSPARNILRYTFFGLFIIALILGVGSIFGLIAPYSAYGRIVTNLLQPVWAWGNNLLASWAANHDSYAFYEVDVWMRSLVSVVIAAVTLVLIAVLAWRNGRTWCNTVCPVGTLLGFLSRFSLLKPVIDTSKCINCGKCARNCKSSCIDPKNHAIDYSRCVVCFDCIGSCSTGAISYRRPSSRKAEKTAEKPDDNGRRAFMAVAVTAGTAAVAHAQVKVDGGLAIIQDKKIPARTTPVLPPGAVSWNHITHHCTGCQLCVAQCPNGVLRPSGNIESLMSPVMSFERGYCRPECTRCGDVCPAGAIHKFTREDKTAIHAGHAVWIKQNCIVETDNMSCGNCARHCPVGAITMMPRDPANPDSLKIPSVDAEKCIGCGACENLCPARPLSAIYVEGNKRQIDERENI